MQDYTYGYTNISENPDEQLVSSQLKNMINAYINANCANMAETRRIPRIIQYLRDVNTEHQALYTDDLKWLVAHMDEDDDYLPEGAPPEVVEEFSIRWKSRQINHWYISLCERLTEIYMKTLTDICNKMTLKEFYDSLYIGEPAFSFEDHLNTDWENINKTPHDTVAVVYAKRSYSQDPGESTFVPLYYQETGVCDAVLLYVPAYVDTEYPSTEYPRFTIWDKEHHYLGYTVLHPNCKAVYVKFENDNFENSNVLDPVSDITVLAVKKTKEG